MQYKMKREKITHTLAFIDDQGLWPNELFNGIQSLDTIIKSSLTLLAIILQVCKNLVQSSGIDD